MEDLIKALQILWKFFKNPETKWPTSCEHDILYVGEVDMSKIDGETVRELGKLGFIPGLDSDYPYVVEELGEDFEGEFSEITDEQWEKIKGNLYGVFYSFRFGSY